MPSKWLVSIVVGSSIIAALSDARADWIGDIGSIGLDAAINAAEQTTKQMQLTKPIVDPKVSATSNLLMLTAAIPQAVKRQQDYNLGLGTTLLEQTLITGSGWASGKLLDAALTSCFAYGGCGIIGASSATVAALTGLAVVGAGVDAVLIGNSVETYLDYRHEREELAASQQQAQILQQRLDEEITLKQLLQAQRSTQQWQDRRSQQIALQKALVPTSSPANGLSPPNSTLPQSPKPQASTSSNPPTPIPSPTPKPSQNLAGSTVAVTGPSRPIPQSGTTGIPTFSATAVDVGRPAPLPEVIAHPLYSTAPNAPLATLSSPLATTPNSGPVPSTTAASQIAGATPSFLSPSPMPSKGAGPVPSTTSSAQPIPAPSPTSTPTQAAGAMVQPAQSKTEIALQSPAAGAVVTPTPSPKTIGAATTIAAGPGGISLSRAAAQQMPLGIALDASYFDGEKIVLSGKAGKIGIDAALFLTALRTACEEREPYFSLDPDDGALWSAQGEQAFKMLWERIEPGLSPRAPNLKDKIGASLEIRTVSARRDYAKIWGEIAPNFPGLRAKLVFYPEWLRQTRFGKVLYEADVLLKELSSGVSVLSAGELRAALVKGYLAADAERAAKSLLSGRDDKHSMTQWRGSRLWFDIIRSPPAAGLKVESEPRVSPAVDAQIMATLSGHGLIRFVGDTPKNTIVARTDRNVFDLSLFTPQMFVRRHDHNTGQDLSDHDPDLDGLANDVTARFDEYAEVYDELRTLREIYRAVHCCDECC